ncbi:MAG: haloacid dehalogenase [Desulfurococcaceae archaeon]
MGSGGVSEVLGREVQRIDSALSAKDRAREEAIALARTITRQSAEAVRLAHLERWGEAEAALGEAMNAARRLAEALAPYPDLLHGGLVQGSMAELAEAASLIRLLREGRLPTASEAGVDDVSYLLGIADLVGELRRKALELLRRGDVDGAERLEEYMEEIYDWLRRLNYPDAILPGLRHKVDVARRLIDDTKSLIVIARHARGLGAARREEA